MLAALNFAAATIDSRTRRALRGIGRKEQRVEQALAPVRRRLNQVGTSSGLAARRTSVAVILDLLAPFLLLECHGYVAVGGKTNLLVN